MTFGTYEINQQAVLLRLIKLMNNLPLLRARQNSKFAYPLAGFVYDNKKYEQTCFFASRHDNNHVRQSEMEYGKSKSTPYVLHKQIQHRQKKIDKSSELFLRTTSKAFNISMRLSSPLKQRCSRSRWISVQQTTPSSTDNKSNSLINTTKLRNQSNPGRQTEKISRFRFNEVEVAILDTITQGRQDLKTIKLDLKRYFQAFFAESLVGYPFQELVDFVQKYMDEVLLQREQDFENVETKVEIPKINSKKGLYQKLLEFQHRNKRQQIITLLKLYCLPSKELRQIFLKDVLNLLGLQLYEQLGLNKENQYVLMTLSGDIINDFAEIKFNTKRLFAANKVKSLELYQNYLFVTKRRKINTSKNIFRETIINNFKEQVAINYQFSPPSPKSIKESREESRKNVVQAQSIINFKNDKTSYGRVRLIQYLQKQQKEKAQRESPSKKKIQSIIQQKHNNIYTIDEKIQHQFKKLKRICDYGNAAFKNDQSCKNKILLGILVRQSIYFKTKTQEQIDRILYALEFIQQGETYSGYEDKTITEQQYFQMRKIINCIGNKPEIVHFVDNFLGYDEFGELQKQELREILAFVIGSQKKTSDVILQTIWCWLEKNGVIINEIIRRSHMQLLYERNKLVYYFLISLIFGTSETSALQLAQEILQ